MICTYMYLYICKKIHRLPFVSFKADFLTHLYESTESYCCHPNVDVGMGGTL